ncbi:MAG: hypothetical protein WKF31_01115 [Thermoleophilaceae bacterium]
MSSSASAGAGTERAAELHPTENRGLRELYVRARDLERHHARLAERLGGGDAATALRNSAARGPAARGRSRGADPGLRSVPWRRRPDGLGTMVAGTRGGVVDRFLERGQAVRVAATDVDAVALLLGYLARTAGRRADERMAGLCTDWRAELTGLGAAVHEAAVAMGDDPDRSVDPLDDSLAGRAGQRAAYTIGAIGEWVDSRLPGRASGR